MNVQLTLIDNHFLILSSNILCILFLDSSTTACCCWHRWQTESHMQIECDELEQASEIVQPRYASGHACRRLRQVGTDERESNIHGKWPYTGDFLSQH